MRITNDEVMIYGMHISPYEKGNIFNKDPLRERKLLMHRYEINKLKGKIQEKGYTLVPLQVYFKGSLVKVEIGLARGKKLYDKRADIAKKDQRRELEPILCGLLSQAPLLPKLRGHFAEFLNNASSVGLRILSSSTCVGLRYGHALHNSSFSRHMAHTLCYFISLHITSSDYTTDLPTVHLPRLYRFFHSRPVLSTCVPTVLIMRGTGI